MYKKVAENRYGQVKYVITIDSGKTLEQEVNLLPRFGHETGCIAECLIEDTMVYHYYTREGNGNEGTWKKLKQTDVEENKIGAIPNTFIDTLTF